MPPTFDDRADWLDGHYAVVRGGVRLTLVLERLAGSSLRRRTGPDPGADPQLGVFSS